MADQEETPKPCWSNILKSQTPPKPNPSSGESLTGVFAGSCKSTKGIAVAIVDANAIIHGGESLSQHADKFVSVPEVMDEVRDPVSRHRLAFVPFDVQTMEPSPESLSKVIKFARSTGDLQTLSAVDLKLIALTYTLEAQIHGTKHLRDCPPPIQTVKVKTLPEKDLPGWGSNVPNLEEWEALEDQEEHKPNGVSRILPLKDLNLNLNLNVVSDTGSEHVVAEDHPVGPTGDGSKKTETNVEGKKKKMVAQGVDASKEEFGSGDVDVDGGDWMPAVSRSTHRRFLRRKARREYYDSLSEKDGVSEKNDVVEEHANEVGEGLENLKISSEVNESVDGDHDDNHENDDDDDESLRSLSESSVACITSDFAMQNVILQMGLRLVAPGGMQIRQLQRWVLRCHACYTVTPEVGKIFCPKCGNGGTLRKVAVTVGENGITLAARRPRVTLRGTKFSLPLPQGGRDAMTKNLVLREDQLPQKYLHPKTKKKVVKKEEGDDFFIREPDCIFSQHHNDNRSYQPPIGKALAVFSGKRNPNDNHYSRSMHK